MTHYGIIVCTYGSPRAYKVASLGDIRRRDEISTLNLFIDTFIEHHIEKFSPHIYEPNLAFSFFHVKQMYS